MRRFVYKQEYVRPEATRVSDGVVVRMKRYEVDPELMGQQFAQQDMPAWDTLRIVEDRNDHLNWMHEHFADETLVAGQESELDLGPGHATVRRPGRDLRRRASGLNAGGRFGYDGRAGRSPSPRPRRGGASCASSGWNCGWCGCP